ncbi:opine metallophore biosynthesis dehydrogenase [Paenibacillus lemnae]|uniref:Opine metallophore biosynthesis dehydrogenase n=1 Tax=Paenibacillus lemnae TaxID=1330551 RepID=A0A848MC94_PAELE|nr:opine metallophore biosynthesis dehydrogenase [Paenibacillus lemnae]NMO97662.1 opine metallophore biosynthesis dehydrogenase [Paenibacillus lemnae]
MNIHREHLPADCTPGADNTQSVLILGTGPASLQLAVLMKQKWKACVGIAGRVSVRSETLFKSLEKKGYLISAEVQNDAHLPLKGECVIDHIFQGYEQVSGAWDTLILAVTTDAYIEVLKKIHRDVLKQAQTLLLVSPTLGSNSLVKHYLSTLESKAEVISFSTYLGDTRWKDDKPGHQVITTGVKKKLYIGSTHKSSQAISRWSELLQSLGLTLGVMDSPIEAETRNISLYVHPPLFMNEFSLNAIFGDNSVRKYVYKMFPEGPITQTLISTMLALWKEITSVVEKMSLKGVNLLQFMTDDNYPVRPESLSRQDIDHFTELDSIHQQYLLYVRYTSLLIDPFSEPDAEGRYFDFSAVPIRTLFVNRDGELEVPRMPKEDYYRIKIIQGIARFLQVDCPMIDQFISAYEHKLQTAAAAKSDVRLSNAFLVQSFEEDVTMICREIETLLEASTS